MDEVLITYPAIGIHLIRTKQELKKTSFSIFIQDTKNQDS